MKAFVIITCLLLGAVVGTLSDSEELSSDLLDCLEEIHPLYKQAQAIQAKCKEEYPRAPENFNEDGIDMTLDPYQEARWQCYDKFNTPELQAKVQDLGERCHEIIINTPDSQKEKVKSLIEQDDWSRG